MTNAVVDSMQLKYFPFLAILLLLLASESVVADTGTVDVSTVYQQLEGFGASVAWYENSLITHPLDDELYDILFGELGLDIYRVRNAYDQDGGAAYIYRSDRIIDEAEESLGHPIKVMISSWSPPDYLKSNGSTIGGTLKRDPCDG